MNTLHGESWKYSTRTVQSRGIKLCFTYNHLHTVSIYHVEAIRKWSYVNSNYCSHRQWKSADYFLSFIATQKEKPLLLPNLSSFGWVCKRYCKLQYIEIMVEKKCGSMDLKSLWLSSRHDHHLDAQLTTRSPISIVSYLFLCARQSKVSEVL